jgi:hypothetical protein
MTAANAVNAKQRQLVDFNAFQGSTFKHRNIRQISTHEAATAIQEQKPSQEQLSQGTISARVKDVSHILKRLIGMKDARRADDLARHEPSGEQVRAALRQLHERSTVVDFQPAQANRALEAAAYSAGVPLSPDRNGPLSFSM